MSPRMMGRKGKGARRPKRTNRNFGRRKVCKYCADKKLTIDYKDGRALMAFTTERGKIIPRRISGACAHHQREITSAIKRARVLALIPYTATQVHMG
jgi:small subunit ribosomal protein S18